METCLGPVSVSSDKDCSCLPGMGKGRGHLQKGNLWSAFRWMGGGQRTLPVSAFSQVHSVQNNHYTKVVFFVF